MTFDEIFFASLWLLILAVLVLDLVGVLHRGTGFRLQAVGLLVMNTAQIAALLAHHHYRGMRVTDQLLVSGELITLISV